MRNINLKKRIFFGLVFLFILLVILVFIPIKQGNINEIKKTRKEKQIVELILVNEKIAPFDRRENKLYFPNDYLLNNMKIDIKSKYNIKYEIVNKNNNIYLFVYSKNYYQKIPVVITKLPIINIVYKDDQDISYIPISSNNDVGSIYSVNNEYFDVGVEFFGADQKKWIYEYEDATLNIRGTSSAYYHTKKSYKLKFNKKIDPFNIYKDDVFALDGLYTDNSKIRNLLASEMWNMINDNQSINTDLVGEYVEVFINGYYTGLYAVKNKVNKKTVDLGNSGLLIKDVWKLNDETIKRLVNNDFVISGFNGYFLSYQIKEYNETAFNNFIEKLRNFYKYDVTYESINKSFEIDNYINYMLLITLISGNDNIVYNKYYSLKNPNSKILLTPWDMDLTFGLNWSYTEELHSSFDMDCSMDKKWLDTYINRYTDKKTYELLKKRYWELRKKEITTNVINSYIDEYEEKLISSKATERDSKRWTVYEVRSEIQKIRKWFKLRLAFLDNYFK